MVLFNIHFHLHNLYLYKILLIEDKFASVGPIFGPFPSIRDRFSIKGFPPDFFKLCFFVLSLSCLILRKTSLETLLCSSRLSSLSSWPGRPSRTEKSSCKFFNCFENENIAGRPSARLVLTDRIMRITTEIEILTSRA